MRTTPSPISEAVPGSGTTVYWIVRIGEFWVSLREPNLRIVVLVSSDSLRSSQPKLFAGEFSQPWTSLTIPAVDAKTYDPKPPIALVALAVGEKSPPEVAQGLPNPNRFSQVAWPVRPGLPPISLPFPSPHPADSRSRSNVEATPKLGTWTTFRVKVT